MTMTTIFMASLIAGLLLFACAFVVNAVLEFLAPKLEKITAKKAAKAVAPKAELCRTAGD